MYPHTTASPTVDLSVLRSDDLFPIEELLGKMEQELVRVRQILLEERQRRLL